MKLIKPSYSILDQKPGLEDIYNQIEIAGRTCYRSQRPEGQTAKDFVDRMIASQHYAMLEHGTVYLHIKDYFNPESSKAIAHYTGTDCIISTKFSVDKMKTNPYSKCVIKGFGAHGRQAYITTNYRVLVENGWLDDLKYLCEPTEFHEKRVTVRFTTDRGVSHEFVRHRVFSFAQESTRYCNYSKDKFGNELTFIIPSWIDIEEKSYDVRECLQITANPSPEKTFLTNLWTCESNYLFLIKSLKRNPQESRQVLPNALKTELVMTGFVSDWLHFFDLRARGITGAPHPDAKALALPLMEEFYKRKLIQ